MAYEDETGLPTNLSGSVDIKLSRTKQKKRSRSWIRFGYQTANRPADYYTGLSDVLRIEFTAIPNVSLASFLVFVFLSAEIARCSLKMCELV